MPKSKVRKKSVYTPPPRSSKSQVSPPWLVPVMLGCLIGGLAWIDALLNASMILGGMGPVDTTRSDAEEVFASL